MNRHKAPGAFNIIAALFLLPATLFGQTSEAQLKTDADKAYRAESWVEASRIYSQLLAFNARDAFYNYRYGVCLIYNSRKKQDAIKHLLYASNQPDYDVEVYYYLGRAYHLNYEFAEAISWYNKYKQEAAGKINVTLQVNRQIENSENGKRLLSSLDEMVVLEKKEIDRGKFSDIYDLKDIGGQIIVNDQFQSKVDKKKGHRPLIHLPAKPDMIFYSSYGENEKNGKDIYIRRKLPDGSWSLPQTVNGGVNTSYDEEFPYFHPNGKYLYFCSKGHNSMGGYDVFRSAFDKEKNSFGPAENLDFPISSPDDDLLYIVDSINRNAFFASARQSVDNKIHVYKVRVEQVPIQIVVVKSAFSSTINPSNKKIAVEIYDQASGNKVGTFNSTEKGSVVISFPKGGKYEYRMTVPGASQEFSTIVSIPFLKEFKPLKQQMIHENAGAGETVRIVNLFDEQVEDPVATMAQIAQMRAELNPNADQFDLNQLDQRKANSGVMKELGLEKLSDKEVVDRINELAETREKQNENLLKLERKALDMIVQDARDIDRLQNDLKKVVAQADSKEGSEKRALYEEAGQMVNEINRLSDQASQLLPTADSLAKQAKQNTAQANQARELSKKIDAAYKEEKINEVFALIAERKDEIKGLQQNKIKGSTETLNDEIAAIREEQTKVRAQQQAYLDDKVSLKKEILQLEKQLAEAKAKDKGAIQKQIDDKNKEIVLIDDELKLLEKKLIKLQEKEKPYQDKLAYFQEIENNKAPEAKVTRDEAAKAIASLDNPNTRSLKAYVAQQNQALGVDMATLKPLEKSATGDRNISTNDQAQNGTNNAAKGNDRGIDQSNPDKTGTNTNGSRNINPENKGQQNGTNDAGSRGIDNEAQQNKGSNNASNRNITASLNDAQKQTLAAISPDFSNNLKAIQNDASLDEEHKLKATQRQEKDMKFLLAKEIAATEEKLKANPEDVNLKKSLEELQAINESLRQSVENKQEELAQKYPETNPPLKLSPSQISNQIKPHHQAVIIDIETNGELSDAERRERAQAEDQKFVAALSQARARIEDELNKDPLNERNKYELGVIKELQAETDARINRRSQEMASFGVSDQTMGRSNPPDNQNQGTANANNGDTENKNQAGQQNNNPNGNENNTSANGDVLLTQLAPEYGKNKEKINTDSKLTEKDKQKALVAEEDKLQVAIDKHSKSLEEELSKKPEDAQLKAEKEQLAALKEQSQSRESESKQLIVSEEKKTIKAETLIAGIDKTFAKDTAAIRAKGGADMSQKLNERETKLQAAIEKKITENTNKNQAKEDLHLQAEIQVLNEAYDDSKARQGQATTPVSDPLSKQNTQALSPESLRKEGLAANPNLLNQESVSPEEFKLLEAYEQMLVSKLQQNEKELQQQPGDEKLTQEKSLLESELDVVQRQKRKFSVGIGPVENLSASNNTGNTNSETNASQSQDPAIAKWEQQEEALRKKMEDPATPKSEKLVLATQINEVKEQKMRYVDSMLVIPDDKIKANPPSKIDKNKLTPEGKTQAGIAAMDNNQLKDLQVQMDALQKKIKETKNPAKKAKLLEEYEVLQNEKEVLLDKALYNTNLVMDAGKMDPTHAVSPFALIDDSTMQIQMDQLNADFKKMKDTVFYWNTKWMKANNRKQAEIDKIRNPLRQEMRYLQERQVHMQKEMERRRVMQDMRNPPLTVSPAPDSAEVVNLHARSNYEALKNAFYKKEDARLAADSAWRAVEGARTRYQQELKTWSSNHTSADRSALDQAQADLAQKESDWKTKQEAYKQVYVVYQKTTAKEKKLLPRLETQFLAERPVPVIDSLINQATDTLAPHVDSLAKAPTDLTAENKSETSSMEQGTKGKKKNTEKSSGKRPASSSNQETASNVFREGSTGDFEFKIFETPKAEPASERIDMTPKNTDGLVFRVQVGAFRNTIKEQMFNEFSPVTGEPIRDGITRYISGYFGSFETANQAKKAIRGLGYRDAFVVAYCNGKRISIAEAKRLMASGECTPAPGLQNNINLTSGSGNEPGIQNQTSGQQSSNTGNQTPTETGTVSASGTPKEAKNTPSSEKGGKLSNYNKAPGAVKAKAVEEYPGLFYTVQIGAYTNPASSKQLKYIDNVVSKKLADGKIRYSTGMFHSIAEAQPTKQMAIEKGITDAFITAYYKGERITLAEAERLLSENGAGILESGK